MAKKVQIHQFDPVIYPFKLWVAISCNLYDLQENFVDGRTVEQLNLIDVADHADAFVIENYVTLKETKANGFLIVFRKRKSCTAPIMAHEATHAARFIWSHLSEEMTGIEADAYLVEWIVSCIEKAKLNKE